MPTYKLTYFNLRYLGEPIRLMFAYAGVPFEDVRVEWMDWIDKDKGLKSSFTWGKLPVLQVDGGQPMSQSCAIMRYLAKEIGLEYTDDKMLAARCDEYADVLKDLIADSWPKYVLAPNAEERAKLKTELMEKHFPHFLGTMNGCVRKSGSKWLVGNKLTWVDFLWANFLQVFEYYTEPGLVAKYPELQRIQNAVMDLPQLKEHIASRPADPKFF